MKKDYCASDTWSMRDTEIHYKTIAERWILQITSNLI